MSQKGGNTKKGALIFRLSLPVRWWLIEFFPQGNMAPRGCRITSTPASESFKKGPRQLLNDQAIT